MIKIVWQVDLSVAAFGKITVVYGQIAENGHDVRKWADRKLAITDKSAKNGTLSVNLHEILTRLVEQHCILKNADKISRKLTAFVRYFI